MSKRTRQYIGILAAVIAYYLVHEGAHLLYALFTGVFRQVNFMGLGVQVDVFRERMTDTQLGIFCLVGALATFCIAYLLTALAKKICTARIKLLRAVLYYITIALLYDRSAFPEYPVRPVRRRRYERDRISAARMGGKDWIRSTSDRKRTCVLETGFAGLQQILFQYRGTDNIATREIENGHLQICIVFQ